MKYSPFILVMAAAALCLVVVTAAVEIIIGILGEWK